MTTTEANAAPLPESRGRRTDTREVILKTALELFADKGYEATSMREIAEKIGISKPALYYHFDSKEDIVRGVLGDQLAQIEELVAWAGSQPTSPILAAEVIERWSDIVQAHGTSMFRFMMSSHQIVREIQGNKHTIIPHLDQLVAALAPDASIEDQLRMRIAFMSINLGGIFSASIDAPEAEVLQAARKVALSLLP